METKTGNSVQGSAVQKTKNIADQMAEYFLMRRFADEMLLEGILDDTYRDIFMDMVMSSLSNDSRILPAEKRSKARQNRVGIHGGPEDDKGSHTG